MASNPVPAGLCATCRHARVVTSSRGSRFVLCERSRSDPRYPRYPALPVMACAGFEEAPPTEAGAIDATDGGAPDALDASERETLDSADITKNGR